MRVGYQERLPNCCGVDDVGTFGGARLNRVRKSGTGLFTATFINNEVNKEAYEQMCEEFTLLYQSPVRVNSNSGNKLFLCVFSWKEEEECSSY